MGPKDADGMANSADPDQTASLAVWSGSTMFAQTCLSENLGSFQSKGKASESMSMVLENTFSGRNQLLHANIIHHHRRSQNVVCAV